MWHFKADATAAIGMVHRLGLGKVRTPSSFREKSSFQNVRSGESERRTNQVLRTRANAAPHENGPQESDKQTYFDDEKM